MHWTAATVLGVCLALVHAITNAAAVYAPTPGRGDGAVAALSLLGLGAAARAASKTGRAPRLPALLVATALATSVGGALLFLGFAGWAGPVLARSVPGIAAVLLGGIVGAAHRELVRPALALGGVRTYLSPSFWLPGGVLLGGWLVLGSRVAPWQEMLLVGALLAAVAWTSEPSLLFLHGVRTGNTTGRRAAALCVAGASVIGLVVSLDRAPPSETRSYPDPVVFSAGTTPRHVVTSGAAGFELYTDHQLAASSLDGRKHADAWLSPALALTPDVERVLVLGRPSGLIARRLLLDDRVREIVVVTEDQMAVSLTESMPWLRDLTSDALRSPRVRLTIDEPVPWLLESRTTFDLVVLDVGAPTDYRVGKAYTTLCFAAIRDRLARGGTAVIPAASAMSTPEAHAAIVAGVRAVGLDTLVYESGIVTIGASSVVLASHAPLTHRDVAVSGEFLDDTSFRSALARTADRSPSPAEPSTLHAQSAVAAFQVAERP